MTTPTARAHSPPTFRALSADAALLRELRERPFRGRVHSVFDRVVNVECAHGELFALASRDIDNAPNTLVTDATSFAACDVVAGDCVAAAASSLAIGARCTIRCDTASEWNGTLEPYPGDETTLRRNVALTRRQLARFRASPAHGTSSLSGRIRGMLDQRAAALRAALCRRDIEGARLHGRELVGLGPGLTPSGDDVLVGMFAALRIPDSPAETLSTLCESIVADAECRTNAISIATLKAAARGRVRESVRRLLRALMTGSVHRVNVSLPPVLQIGSTSGADIVRGVIAGFEVQLHIGGSPCKSRSNFLAV